MITSSDFRYVDSPRFWRFTFEQTEDLLKRLWPGDAAEGLALLRRISGSGPEVPGNPDFPGLRNSATFYASPVDAVESVTSVGT